MMVWLARRRERKEQAREAGKENLKRLGERFKVEDEWYEKKRAAAYFLTCARSREHNAKAQVWEDIHEGLVGLFGDNDGLADFLIKYGNKENSQ